MAQLFQFNNGASPAAAALVKVTTGIAVKTMLQVLNASFPIKVVEWGISFDGSAAATPIQCELIHTTTVAATVVAHVANDITQLDNSSGGTAPATAGFTLSTTGCGYTASAEGTVVAPVRTGDVQMVAPTNQYVKQFPLGREFYVPAAGILRVRVTAASAVNAYTYVVVEV